MNKIFFLIGIFIVSMVLIGCSDPSANNKYNYVWQPSSTNTWYVVLNDTLATSSSVAGFKVTSSGFEYTVSVDSTGRDTSFTPKMYIVNNIITASRMEASFDISIRGAVDTLLKSDSSKIPFAYVSSSGTTISIGANNDRDSKLYDIAASSILSGKSENKNFTFSTNPDKCSKQIRIRTKLNWIQYSGTVPLKPSPMPKSKTVTVVVSNLKITTYGIDVMDKP